MRRIYSVKTALGRHCDTYPKHIFVLIAILCLGFSCSAISTLNVNYRLPPADPGNVRGEKIALAFEDARETKRILKDGAFSEFESFSGNISLSLAGDDEEVVPLGLYDPKSLFMEAFRRRFKNIGVEAVREGGEAQVGLAIVLKEFSLDLVERKWIAKMGYEAVVKRGGRVAYRHNIRGEGERLKLVGTSQADALLSEIFTDVINRLDLEKVYRGDLPEPA